MSEEQYNKVLQQKRNEPACNNLKDVCASTKSLSVPITPTATPEQESLVPPLFPEDIFIVSYPRSGNTWMRFLLANLIADSEQSIDFLDMEKIVPSIHSVRHWDEIRSTPPGRLLKSHMPYDLQYKRVIYIVRDGRDVMVSYYYYHYPHVIQINFLEFLKRNYWPCPWNVHVGSWLTHTDNIAFLFVRYEDLLEQPEEQLKRAAKFIGLPTDTDRIRRAVGNSALDVMQRSEAVKGHPTISSPGFKFFRKGTSGDWKEHFGPEHKAVFKQKANHALLKLGYIDGPDW